MKNKSNNSKILCLKISKFVLISMVLFSVFPFSSFTMENQHLYPASKIDEVIRNAREYIGSPYVSGGSDKSGTDSSGFIHKSFLATGIDIFKVSRERTNFWKDIFEKDNLQKGDLIFFKKDNGKVDHIGLVVSVNDNGKYKVKFIHSSEEPDLGKHNTGVRESFLDEQWGPMFVKGARIFETIATDKPRISVAVESNNLYPISKIDEVIRNAREYIGTPYLWGGNSKSGIDCSALMRQSFRAAGIDIPRNSREQAKFRKGIDVERDNLQKGDLVFFKTSKGIIGIVGLIVSITDNEVKFIYSSTTNQGVKEEYLKGIWEERFIKGKRLFNTIITRTVKTQHLYPKYKADEVIKNARSYIGTPYMWGGNSRSGIDTSALMQQSFRAAGIDIPRVSREQAAFWKGIDVAKNNLQKGDLIFFRTKHYYIGQVGLVVSVNDKVKFIHSSSESDRGTDIRGVRESWLDEQWEPRFVKGVRLFED